MKTLLPLAIFALMAFLPAVAQTTLNPDDPIVIYNRDRPPADPPWGSIGKWVITNSPNISWGTGSFKAYVYKGMAFRLKFPGTYRHGVADGKKYPVSIFFHGLGEARPYTDNNLQLLNGGRMFRDAVDNGVYDGFLLYPQSQGAWGPLEYDKLSEILDSMALFTKADLNRIAVSGLSSGAYASWEFMIRYPQKVSASLPMSGVSAGYGADVNSYKYTPIWLFQGGLDGSPAPYTAQQVVNLIRNAGGTIN
jgi:predicted peptidase